MVAFSVAAAATGRTVTVRGAGACWPVGCTGFLQAKHAVSKRVARAVLVQLAGGFIREVYSEEYANLQKPEQNLLYVYPGASNDWDVLR